MTRLRFLLPVSAALVLSVLAVAGPVVASAPADAGAPDPLSRSVSQHVSAADQTGPSSGDVGDRGTSPDGAPLEADADSRAGEAPPVPDAMPTLRTLAILGVLTLAVLVGMGAIDVGVRRLRAAIDTTT